MTYPSKKRSNKQVDALGESTEGMADSTSKMQAKIKGLTGFDIMDENGAFKSTYDITKGLAEAYKTMDDIDRAALLELVAGKTRANQVAALFNNVNAMESAYNNALNSAGTAAKENAVYLDSIAGRTAQLQASFQQLSSDVVSSDIIKFFISLTDEAIQATDWVMNLGSEINKLTNSPISAIFGVDRENQQAYFDQLKALPSIIAAISAALTINNKGQALDGILGIKNNALCSSNRAAA